MTPSGLPLVEDMTIGSAVALAGAAVLGYLLGSIPLPYIVTRVATGKDLRTVHTGNVGVMNSASVLGWRLGFGVLLAELFKGMACAWLGMLVAGYAGSWAALVAGVAGANWSIYLRGAGGRGNTTFGGGLLAIAPVVFVTLAGIFLTGRSVTGSAFVAARLNMLLMPLVFAAYGWYRSQELSVALLHGVVGLTCALIFRAKHSRDTDDHMALRRDGHLPGGPDRPTDSSAG